MERNPAYRHPIAGRALLAGLLLLAVSCGKEKEAGVHGSQPAEVIVPQRPEVTLAKGTVIAYREGDHEATRVGFSVEPPVEKPQLFVTSDGASSFSFNYDEETGTGEIRVSWRRGASESSSAVTVAARNDTGEGSASFTVFPAFVSFADKSIHVDSEETSITVALHANVPVSVSKDEDCDWIRFGDMTERSVVVRAIRNPSEQPRTSTVLLQDLTRTLTSVLTVTQDGIHKDPGGDTPGGGDPPGGDEPPTKEYLPTTGIALLSDDGTSVQDRLFETGDRTVLTPSYTGTGTPQSYSVAVVEGSGAMLTDGKWLTILSSGTTKLRVEAVMSGTLTYYRDFTVRAVCPVYTGLVCWYVDEHGSKEWSNTGIFFQCACDETTKVSVSGTITAKSIFGTWTQRISGFSGKSVTGRDEFLLLKYTDLESFVKSHLTASFSVALTVSVSTGDRRVYFVPSDSMKRLLDSTGKDIPVTVNGKTFQWNETMTL